MWIIGFLILCVILTIILWGFLTDMGASDNGSGFLMFLLFFILVGQGFFEWRVTTEVIEGDVITLYSVNQFDKKCFVVDPKPHCNVFAGGMKTDGSVVFYELSDGGMPHERVLRLNENLSLDTSPDLVSEAQLAIFETRTVASNWKRLMFWDYNRNTTYKLILPENASFRPF